MENGDIPDEVLRFILARIDTVPHLEALLLMWQNAASEWTEEQVASRIYVPVKTARVVLDDLVRQGLVRHAGNGSAYRYDPEGDAAAQILPKVADAYSKHLVRIATLIHSKASASVREFARAFQIKNE